MMTTVSPRCCPSSRTRSWIRAAVVLTLPLWTPLAARAQAAPTPNDLTRMSIEDLLGVEFDKVYGASRFVQDIRRAPASVTIISAEDIDRHGYRTISEAVETAAGFYATNDRNYTTMGVRGFNRQGDYNTRLLVLIDGHRLNDNIYDAAYLGTEFPVDMGLVERIEIIRGPRSSVYGSNAFFAVINVLTRHGREVGKGEISATAGNRGTVGSRVTLGGKTPSTDWLVSGSGFRSAGDRHLFYPEFNSPATNNGVAVDRDHEDAQSLFGKLSHGGLAIEGAWSRRFKAVPTASFGTIFNDPREQTTDGRSYVNVEYGRNLSRTTELLVRAYFDHVEYEGHYPAPWFQDPSLVSLQNDQGHGESIGTDWLLTRRAGGRHLLTAGADLFTDLNQSQVVIESASPTMPTVDEHRLTNRWSVHAQDDITLGTHAILNLGLRHDWHSTFGGTTNPRVGLVLMPSADSTVKLLYGTAYRAPSGYELYYDTRGLTNHLEPERIRTAEVIAEQRLGRHVRASALYFDYHIEHLINQVEKPSAYYGVGFANANPADARGVEVSAEGRFGEMTFRLGQTVERISSPSYFEITNSPKAITRLGLTLPLARRRAYLGLDGDYVSERLTKEGALPGRYKQHLNLSIPRLGGRLDLGLLVRNLFDTRYSDPAGDEHVQDAIPRDGRTVQLRASFRF